MGLFALLWFLFIILLWQAMATTSTILPMAKPHCSDKCGNITVPYPYGFGDDESCYRSGGFVGICNYSYDPPKLFLGKNVEVLRISLQGQVRVLTYVSRDCYNTSGKIHSNSPYFQLKGTPRTFSDTQNKFTVLGCDTNAFITGSEGLDFKSGCNMICKDKNDTIEGSCSGIGCCQTSIPKGFKRFDITVGSYKRHTEVLDFNPCSYAFLVDVNWYNFSVSDLLNFSINTDESGDPRVPVVLDWAIELQTNIKGSSSCEEAKKDQNTYACGNNSDCHESKNGLGYSCNCSQGYQGNPYLSDGCQDINECTDPNGSPCNVTCTNLLGSYNCSCPPGYLGDGKKNGTGCSPPQKLYKPIRVIQITLGAGLCSLFLLIGSLLVLGALQKREDSKRKREDNERKQKFFEQNGGFLLTEQLPSRGGPVIFKEEELKQATDNYDPKYILGAGGYGTVYKGILSDQRTVAIKKSKKVDKHQEHEINQFINEVVVLSGINHKNVVKLLGCCLETEVPMLVYEFITNKNLFHHIHGEECISWDNRLRIAAETSEALAYLHSAASPPIIHRDIKSANILLEDNYVAKVSDFGASVLVSSNKTQISTLVEGTKGYLDPEYLQSRQFIEKSDVYSFGVVLAELLTGMKALYLDELHNETNLAMHFVTSIKEDRVQDILLHQIMSTDEGCKEQALEVVKLAESCLKVKGEERPTMKEVEIKLQGLMKKRQRHPWIAQIPEEVECLLGEPSEMNSDKTCNTIGWDSLTNQVIIPLDGGR
ncbi:wall-associated receptor kinase 2-like [Telopea speciosissima]|uniref:wall-associated receptor kinase 2-like n=1 Tax=Telopea speciosissima TaxID=54955 RepID=UPI001CC809AE|nr:wall-associated receptor kinase 2-like [Telopea speciosissima]